MTKNETTLAILQSIIGSWGPELVLLLAVIGLGVVAWVLFQRIPGKPPPREFVEWCRSQFSAPAKFSFDVQSFEEQCTIAGKTWASKQERRFFEQINGKLESKQRVSVRLNRDLSVQPYRIVGTGKDHKNGLTTLEISRSVGEALTVEAVAAEHFFTADLTKCWEWEERKA